MEKSLVGADALEEASLEVDLNDISSSGSEVGHAVVWRNFNALENSLDLAHVDVLVSDLLGYEVAVPDTEAVVVDGDELVVGVVKEFDLVGDVHTDWVTAEGFASFNVPDHKRVVVLSSKRSKVLFVSGEGKILDHFLVKFQSLDHLQSVEIPNDDVCLHAKQVAR